MSVNGQKRLSNIELLRVVAMVMIVAGHFAGHSDFDFTTKKITINRLWIQFLQGGGKLGVNVFVLISGYFLVTVTTIKISKIIKLWIQIFTYSVVVFFVFVGLGIESFDIKQLIRHLFPVTFNQWWFASTYFVFYLFIPYVNKLLSTFDKKVYLRFLVLLTFCWCIIPTFLYASWQCNELLWFVYLYALAGYIRLYVNLDNVNGKKCILFAGTF